MNTIVAQQTKIPKIAVSIFYGFSPDFERQRMDRAVEDRLAYLDEQFDVPENRALYEHTKQLLRKTLRTMSYTTYPLVGVDDNGQIVAEWHDYDDFLVITITPVSENRIVFKGVQKNGLSFTVNTSLANLEAGK